MHLVSYRMLAVIKKNDLAIFKCSGVRGRILQLVYSYVQSIPPTSVEAERAFSAAETLCTKIRSPSHHITTGSSAIAEGPRDASCQLKSCQLPPNSAETTYTTSPDRIDGMKLEI